ncbi:hypothetical protein Tco_1225612 [Tanacetum coccineum]
MDEDQAGPDPGISPMALVGPDPEPTHGEFMADLYPKVQESLKFSADEHFINDKSTNDEPSELNVEAKVVSIVTIPIYQASLSVPPLSTPVIDLLPSKPTSSTTHATIFTATTTLPPPPQPQSVTESKLAERSRVFTLELSDLPYNIDEVICENVKEAVQIAIKAPLRERFRDLPKADMKEMIQQWMFETGSYKSLPKHLALYEALEASMKREQSNEFFAELAESRKRQCDESKAMNSLLLVHHSLQLPSHLPRRNTASVSDSEDTGYAYRSKSKQRPEWLKPIPEDDMPVTLEPA